MGAGICCARLSNPYGRQQNPNSKQGAIGVFLGNVAQGKPITIWGDGEVVRDYIYIDDAVKALVKAAEYKPEPNGERVFNIGAGNGHSLNEIVEAIKKVVDVPVKVNYTEGRPVDVPANVAGHNSRQSRAQVVACDAARGRVEADMGMDTLTSFGDILGSGALYLIYNKNLRGI